MARCLRAATALLAATAFVALAASAGAGTTKLSGVGVFNDDCIPSRGDPPADVGDYPPLDLAGSLNGCWYTYVSSAQSHPSGSYQESGSEMFVGCLNGTCGTFTTTYTFTGKFAPGGAEIHGRCHHAIVAGTGGFAGASGQINFKDDVDAGLFFYQGSIMGS